MTKDRQALGKWGEAQAAEYLTRLGYKIIGRNVRTPYGELDLIAQVGSGEGSELVFVEVKTRASYSLGPPEISVDRRKQAHLIASAEHYLTLLEKLPAIWRIDVIAIQRTGAHIDPEIIHFENAVTDLT